MAYRTPTEMSMTRFAKLRWLGWMVLAISSLVLPAAALAQQGAFQVGILSPETAQERIPALISVLRGGEIIGQNEVVLGASSLTGWITAKLGLGVYDVRVEAEGLRTEVKRGVRVLDGQSTNVTFVVRRGTGVHIVEYATGGLSREEVAARLTAAESSISRLQRLADSTMPQSQPRAPEDPADPCCTITSIDAKTGLVTARISGTVKWFRFRPAGFEPIDSARLLSSLKVGQKVWLNFDTRMVSINWADPCCPVVGPAVRP